MYLSLDLPHNGFVTLDKVARVSDISFLILVWI